MTSEHNSSHNLGIALLRAPTPELVSVILDGSKTIHVRWQAYLQADGFNLNDYSGLSATDPTYVMSELQRVCKELQLPKHASKEDQHGI